jgi:ABC-type multidrug transport system fused ATPase/permease subunit
MENPGAVPPSSKQPKEKSPAQGEAKEDSQLTTIQIARRLGHYALPQRRALIVGLALLTLQTLMEVLKPWPLALTLDRVVSQAGIEGATFRLLLVSGAFIVAIAFFEGLFNYFRMMVVARAGRTIVRDIRAAAFDHVQKLSLQYHSRKRSGDLLLRVSSDVQSLQKALTDSMIEVINCIVFLLAILAIMIVMDWQIGLVALAGVPILFVYIKRYSAEIRNYTTEQRQREGALASLFHEAIGSTRLTRVFNRESTVRGKFESESKASLELALKAELREERFGWTVEVLGAVLTAVVLIFAVYRAQAGAITEGELFLFFFYGRSVYRPIRTGVKNASRVWRSLAQAERVIELLDMENGVTDAQDAREAPPFRGEIELRDVSFRYDSDQPFIEHVNLRLPAKRITAVVGPTGAGKTTLVSMVPRLYDPIDGQVLIDGHDIREFTLESLREQISVVLQESTLLYASVADNIAYGRPGATRDDVEAAAWLSGAHDFIKDLPKGYETEVGERGETLSGGQRQLIAIARAIIRDAPIVILDEPMTGLDPASALQVRDGLERLMANKTVLFITHNLSLVDSADNVIVVADGAVVQQGTPNELRRSGGPYQRLFRAQFEQDTDLALAR